MNSQLPSETDLFIGGLGLVVVYILYTVWSWIDVVQATSLTYATSEGNLGIHEAVGYAITLCGGIVIGAVVLIVAAGYVVRLGRVVSQEVQSR